MKNIKQSGTNKNLVNKGLKEINEMIGKLNVNAYAIGFIDEESGDAEPEMIFWYRMPKMKIKTLKGCTLHIEFKEIPQIMLSAEND